MPDSLYFTAQDVYVVGVDLAQVQDFTAVVVDRISQLPTGELRIVVTGARWREQMPVTRAQHEIAHVDRWRDRSYANVARYLRQLSERIDHDHRQRLLAGGHRDPASPAIHLVLDRTGVGAGVIDHLRETFPQAIGITITAGNEAHSSGWDWWVPKADLVAAVQVELQNRWLTIADVPLRDVLLAELRNFKARISVNGHVSYEASERAEDWRGGGADAHDDCVLALALAVWYADRGDRARRQGQAAVEVFQNAYAAAYRSG